MSQLLFQGVEGETDRTREIICKLPGQTAASFPVSLLRPGTRRSPSLNPTSYMKSAVSLPFTAIRDAARQAYLALYALQHRGQESAGIATADGQHLANIKGMGLVSEIFTDDVLAKLPGPMAIGHTRYSTTGDSALLNAQPIRVDSTKGLIAIAHNGNLVNLGNVRARAGARRRLLPNHVRFRNHRPAHRALHARQRLSMPLPIRWPDRWRVFHRDDDARPHLCCPRSTRLPAALHGPHQEP